MATIFTLIWKKGLIDIEEVPAANYTAETPNRVAWVTQEDVKDNFINYILNDVSILSRVALT